jgi:hypothetical protein
MLLGLAYLAALLTSRLTPRAFGPPESTLTVAKFAPGWFWGLYGEMALAGLLGLAVVGAISDLVEPGAPAWIEWTRRLGYLGFAMLAIESVRLGSLIPQMAGWYFCHCTSQEQTAVLVSFTTVPLDPARILTFGVVAVWIASVSVAGLRAKRLPAILGYLGLLLAVSYLLLVVALWFGIGLVILLDLTAAGVLSGAWYLWLGWRLVALGNLAERATS